MEGNILHHPRVSRVLAEKYVTAKLWLGRDEDADAFAKKVGMSAAIPQYALVDGEGNLRVLYDRPQNVASMTPESFAKWLEDSLAGWNK